MSLIFPLRRVIPLALFLTSLPLAALTYYFQVAQAEKHIDRRLLQEAAQAGDQVATRIRQDLSSSDWNAARDSLQMIVPMREVRWAVLVDNHHRVILSTDYRLIDKPLSDMPNAPPTSLIEAAQRSLTAQTAQNSNRSLTWSIYPLRLPLQRGELRSQRIGAVILTLDSLPQRDAAKREALSHALLSIGSILLLAFLVWLYLRIFVLRRIEILTAAAQSSTGGKHELPQITGRDEIAELARHFTALAGELDKNNQTLRAIFEQSFQFTGIISLDGLVRDVNELALKFAQARREDVIGKPFWETPWWTHDVQEQQRLKNAIDAARQGEHIAYETTHLGPDDKLHYVDFSLKPILGSDGTVKNLLAEGHDITSRKLAEERIRRLNALYSTLSYTNQSIVRLNSANELYPEICRIAVEHGGLKGAFIGLIDPETNLVSAIGSYGVADEYAKDLKISIDPSIPEGQGPTAKALRDGRPYICNDFLADPNTQPWRERATAVGIRSSAAFPLFQAGKVAGALNLYAGETDFFTGELLRLLEEMVLDVSFSLENLARIEELNLAASVFDNSREIIIVTDAQSNIIKVNKAFTEVAGYTPEEVIGQNISMLRAGTDDSIYHSVNEALNETGYWQGELWNRRKDGESYPVWMALTAVKNDEGAVMNYISISLDITEHMEAEERIRHLAYYDPLTNLPNRTLVRDRVEQALVQAERDRHQIAMLFLDLDHFKNVNDSLGHAKGDQLLVSVAERLRTIVRRVDTVGRLGGDEFLIMLHDSNADIAAHIAQKILDVLATPVFIDGHELIITGSIGMALFPRDGHHFDELLQHADAAMYKVKELSRNDYFFFTPELNASVFERLTLETGLRRAIKNNELLLHFQPQINIASGRITSFEALLRWHHPELGMVPPGKFIPVAEESSLISAIGAWVLYEACRQNKVWLNKGLPATIVAVNVSTRQFVISDVFEAVKNALDATGLPPDLLELEITESLLVQDMENTLTVLHRIKNLGVHITVDDFGTGYSSMAYLKRFPIERLKIDQSFVEDLPDSADDLSIASGIVHLGHSLGMSVVAEGVETQAQLETLREIGCDQAQGYLFSQPLPPDDAEATLQDNVAES
ncbi:MAG: EAL domain-containing protein [Gammaproteobacteria bacterium]|jgi:diguanylate cyclase (GGDEF)-like protein/PAS domain S-box-containing protein